jgi:hypothetical protein
MLHLYTLVDDTGFFDYFPDCSLFKESCDTHSSDSVCRSQWRADCGCSLSHQHLHSTVEGRVKARDVPAIEDALAATAVQ